MDRPAKRIRGHRWTVLLLVAGWLGISFLVTGESIEDSAEAAPPVVRDNTLPYNKDWLEVHWVLRTKCSGCHRPNSGQHDFSTYEAVMADGEFSGEPIVIPGLPEESLLWKYVNWNHAFDPDSDAPERPDMPPDDKGEWLSKGQLETLHRWIESGALEYVLPPTCDTSPLLETDFVSARECAQCHPRQYEEWSRSMHAYAQHSPVFEAFTLTMVERTGGTIGTFCTRCHTPIGVSIGEDASMRNVHRSRISMEGVTCVVCHRLEKPFYKASGRLPVTPGLLRDGCMYGPFKDSVDPDGSGHPAEEAAHLTKSSFCGSCHDVTNPVGVRLEEAFSEWQNSPAAKQGISCQDCHMGPIPGVPVKACDRPFGKVAVVPGIDPDMLPDRPLSNHSFVGPDYSMLPDTEFPYKLDWMYETDYRDTKNLTPHQRETLTHLRVQNRKQLAKARNLRFELLKNAAEIRVEHPREANRHRKMKVHVDVVSKTAGHNFPTGFTAERQVWVELILVDPLGRTVFSSGDLDSNGDLRDEHSHEVEAGHLHWDRHLLNFQSKFTLLTVQGTERSVIIPVNRDLTPINVVRPNPAPAQSFGRPADFRVAKASLPPLDTMGNTYPIRLGDCAGPHRLRVRLNYRNLPPALFDKIGIPHLKHLIETVVIDEYESVIDVR
ncbi:multiheme c-type cytochrome [Thalassoglobus sp. JC818]|uniref:multiheme c-type cytochrome n=1 Tax=Thalassoglobus sp. JC818 TaxID=3232136 RepID=UPI003458584C